MRFKTKNINVSFSMNKISFSRKFAIQLKLKYRNV